MVKLKLFPALGVDGPLQASGAMPSVAGMVFMSIYHSNVPSAHAPQHLVALQAPIDVLESPSQSRILEQGIHASHRIDAGHGLPQPMFPERRSANHLQSMEAAQASPVQSQNRLQHKVGGDAREGTAIGNPLKNLLREVEDLFRIVD